MTSFHEISFPLPLSFGASGGPQRHTEIITLASGHEQRNASTAQSRRRYDAGVGVKTLLDMHTLIAFFEARMGQLYGFRFHDPIDYKSCAPNCDIQIVDQKIGIGNGQRAEFELVKTYQDDASRYKRFITKPKQGRVLVAINGKATTAFTLDASIGIITFDTPPQLGLVVSAGFEFDVPVRFNTDQISTSLESFGAGSAINVPLIEILPHA
ncbi:MAG: DUF2460 domain-containing protein [Robiginitomaculum sp.]